MSRSLQAVDHVEDLAAAIQYHAQHGTGTAKTHCQEVLDCCTRARCSLASFIRANGQGLTYAEFFDRFVRGSLSQAGEASTVPADSLTAANAFLASGSGQSGAVPTSAAVDNAEYLSWLITDTAKRGQPALKAHAQEVIDLCRKSGVSLDNFIKANGAGLTLAQFSTQFLCQSLSRPAQMTKGD